jgi:MFS family permease
LFVILRLGEGIAAAAVLPSARALIADAVPAEKQGQAFGIFSGFFNAGFLLGPAIGGLLAATGYATAFIGAALFRVLALVVVIVFIPRLARSGVTSTKRTIFRRGEGIFRLPLLGAYIIAFGDYLWLGFDLAILPLWLHDHVGATVVTIGLAYTAWAIPSVILTPLGGFVADRAWRSHLILVFGLAQVPL